MANLSTKTFVTMVRDQAAAIQSRAASIVDFTVGSIMLAAVESNAAISLWLQGLILKLLTVTRAATSIGADLDSWVGDFRVARAPAVAATTLIRFSRYTSIATVVPVGTQLQTLDTKQSYAVYADAGNGSYSADLGGYVMPAGLPSLNIPVRAINTGAQGNVLAGAISLLRSAVIGIDIVSNVADVTNGIDAESDMALRIRFIAFILSLREATRQSVEYAISTVQQGLSWKVISNKNFDGSVRYGYFTVVINDGSGSPPQELLDRVYLAIDPIRALTVMFGVFAPLITTVNGSMVISVADGYSRTTVIGQVYAAIAGYINSLGIGQKLSYAKLAQIAFNASPGVTDVTSFTVNSGVADVDADDMHIIRVGTFAVN